VTERGEAMRDKRPSKELERRERREREERAEKRPSKELVNDTRVFLDPDPMYRDS
jgi:hypothetical protein